MWQYHLVKLLSKIICILPDTMKKLIGTCLGKIFWLVTPRWRQNLAINQAKQCLNISVAEAKKIAYNSVIKYGHMIVEVLCFPLLTKDNIHEKVVIRDKEKLEQLFAQNKGVVLATAHFGNWELCGAALALYGFPLVAVALKQHNDAMDRFINEYRTLVGEHVTYNTGVLEMKRMLDKGYGIGLLTDQDGGKDGVIVDFFGRPTSCPKGSVALARMTGRPMILLLMSVLRDDGVYEIFTTPMIAINKTKDREEDIRDATQRLMKELEEEIKKQPEMWFWLHNRWKRPRSEHKNIVQDD